MRILLFLTILIITTPFTVAEPKKITAKLVQTTPTPTPLEICLNNDFSIKEEKECVIKTIDTTNHTLVSMYKRVLRKNPSLRGNITFKIDSNMKVTLGSSELGEKLSNQMLNRINYLDFGKLVSIQKEIDITLNFEP